MSQSEESDRLIVDRSRSDKVDNDSEQVVLNSSLDDDDSSQKWSLGKFLVNAAGIFTDSYDLFVMGIVNVILAKEYSSFGAAEKSRVSTAAIIGVLIGQLSFGRLADRFGRKSAFIATCLLLLIGAIVCSIAPAPSPAALFWSLTFGRLLLGIGIGGEYPLAAAVGSETASAKRRGRDVGLIHAMQGLGTLVAAIVGYLLVHFMVGTAPYNPAKLDQVWRISFGLAAIPPLLVLYGRITMKETKFFTQADQHTQHHTPSFAFIFKHYHMRMIGTAGCWFINDILFYGLNIWSATLLSELSSQPNKDRDELADITFQNLIIAIIALPGHFIAAFMVDSWGRKRLQFGGFLALCIVMFVFFVAYTPIAASVPLFVFFLGLSLLIANMGPNSTCFIVASEYYPSKIRATAHGMSAATGKIGAALGTFTLVPVKTLYGTHIVFLVFSILALVGVVLTGLFIEERSGSRLEDEDHEFDQLYLQYQRSLNQQEQDPKIR